MQVQYPGLDVQVGRDFAMLTTCLNIVGHLFPSFQYSWMVKEFQHNMERELDFTQVRRKHALLLRGNVSAHDDAPTVGRRLAGRTVAIGGGGGEDSLRQAPLTFAVYFVTFHALQSSHTHTQTHTHTHTHTSTHSAACLCVCVCRAPACPLSWEGMSYVCVCFSP